MAASHTISQAALDVLLTDFGHSNDTRWFLDLSPDDLLSALGDQRLNVREEDEVYEAVVAWYRHKIEARQSHLPVALSKLRLANLSRRVLVDHVLPLSTLCCPPDVSGQALMDTVQRALAYHLLPDRRHDELIPSAVFRPSQASERVLLVLGDQSDQLYAYSFARRAWFKLASPPHPLGLGVAACSYDDDLYTSGGDKVMNKVFRYRAMTNTWKQLPDLKVGRRSHVTAAVGDKLYVVGGKDDKQASNRDTLKCVEMLRLKAKGEGWVTVTSATLPVPVRSMGHAVVGDKIYLIGGRTNGFQKDVDVIQCLDTITRQSSIVGHLSNPSCLARPFVSGMVTFFLEVNGDVTMFHSGEEPKCADLVKAHGVARENGDTVLTVYHVKAAPHQAVCHTVSGSEPEPHTDSAATLSKGKTETGEDGVVEVKAAQQPTVRRVAKVRGMDWKWAGAARDERGVLYVVAGERSGSAQAPDLSVVVDVDLRGADRPDIPCPCCKDRPHAAGGRGECEACITRVCFIRPEKMTMCYVTAHASIPKQYLLQKLA